MKDAEPKAKYPKQENRTETSKDGPEDVRGQRGDSDGRQRAVRATTDVAAASVERKRKTEQETAQMQQAPPDAKQRKEDGGTKRSTDRQAEMSCKQQSKGSATETSGKPQSHTSIFLRVQGCRLPAFTPKPDQ